MDSLYAYRAPEPPAPRGSGLQGLKIAVQPNIQVAGWPSEAGSKALAGYTALEDATVIERLKKAGAYLTGSTLMSEFGFGLWNSKACSALKEKEADAELVLDLMGESRLAASRANVSGFKPSYGLISRYGIIGLIPSMESCGILSESIGTIRAILEMVAGQDEKDFSLPDEKLPDFSKQDIEPRKITLGYVKEILDTLTPEKKQSFDSAIEKLKSAGFPVKEVSLPDFPLFSLVHKIVGSVEASSAAGRYDSVRYGQRVPGTKNWNDMYLKSREAAFGTLLKSYLFQGAYFQFERYKDFEYACRIRTRLLDEMERIRKETDFLVFPIFGESSNEEPVLPDDIYAQFAGTLFANVSGWPALVIPSGSGNGMQLAGPRLSDGKLLSLGEYLLTTGRGGK